MRRRTQHYGYKYNYTARTLSEKDNLGPLPDWIDELIDYLMENANLTRRPDQVIINEYQPGQGISPHIDKKDIFDEYICSLSLGSAVIMVYSKFGNKKEIYLEPCSLLEMTGEARYKWLHSIPARKLDIINDKEIMRATRYSITFRKVKLEK